MMKISISSQGPNPDSMVDPRFGRAAQFLVYDTDTASYEVVSNSQSLEAAQGAGIKAAETISKHGAQVVITGHCGPKAFSTLKAAGIEIIIGADGLSVSEAVDKYQSGQFNTTNSSDVTGHWK
jgi:predicted Fe-Mo cluster-binding NifX family protein